MREFKLINRSSHLTRVDLEKAPIRTYSICRDHNRPTYVQFWFSSEVGVEFSTNPIEIDDRTEAGVLTISDAENRNCASKVLRKADWLARERSIDILVHRKGDVVVQSGLRVSSADRSFWIVPSVMPHFLALYGDVQLSSSDFEPEFELPHYTLVPWS